MQKRILIINLILTVLCVFMLGGCISTEIKSFTDPSYPNYNAQRFMIIVVNAPFDFTSTLERDIIRRLNDKGIEAISFQEVFPPTRTPSKDEFSSKLKGLNIDSVLSVSLGSSSSSNNVIAYQNISWFNVNNTYNNYSGFGTGLSMPINNYERITYSRSTLYETDSGNVVWIADLKTHARGSAYAKDISTIRSLSEKIISDLTERGHLIK